MAQGLLVIDVAELAETGADLDAARARTPSRSSPRSASCAMLDTLEHLIKGGRVGGARALLGQVLSIKPLLELKDGVVAEAGRQRTRAKALVAIAEVAKSHAPLKRLALVHGASSEVAGARRRWSPTSRRRTRSSSPTWVRSWAPTAGRGSSDCAGSRRRGAVRR